MRSIVLTCSGADRWWNVARVSLLMLVGSLGVAGDASGYEKDSTHRTLAARSVDLAITDSRYAEIGFNGHRDKIYHSKDEAAVVREDDCPRQVNHFFDPSTSLGLPENYYTWAFALGCRQLGGSAPGEFARYFSALDWARDGMSDGLDWKGAIETYDYTVASKEQAYAAVGHVLHLLHDMAQPDHARNRPHPCNVVGVLAGIKDRVGYETLWKLQQSWPGGTAPRKLETLEKAFTDLAYESQQAEDSLGLPLPGDELTLGCRAPSPLTLEALKASGGVWTEAPGALIYDANVLRLILAHGWNSLYDSHWQETELDIPLVPTIPVPPGDFRTRAYLQLGRTMLAKAEEYGAGLLRLFYDIVNPPPYVEEVEIYQNGQRKYRKTWKDETMWKAEISADHVIRRHAEVEGGELDPGIEAELFIRIGPKDLDFKPDNPGPYIRKALKAPPSVSVVPNGGRPEEVTQVELREQPEPTSPSGGTWVGKFTPTRSATLRITGTDSAEHFKDRGGQREQSLTPGDGKHGTQGDLDADPSTPARATWRESNAAGMPAGVPYPWIGYEAGPDMNHHFKVQPKTANCLDPVTVERIRWGKWRATYSHVEDRRSNCPPCGRGGDERFRQTQNGTREFVAFGELEGPSHIVLHPLHQRETGKLLAVGDVAWKDGTHAHREQNSNYEPPELPPLRMCSNAPDPIEWEHEQSDPSGDNFLRVKQTWTFAYLGAYEPEPIRLLMAAMPLDSDPPFPRLRDPSHPLAFLPDRDSVILAYRSYIHRLEAILARSQYQYSTEISPVFQMQISDAALQQAWETVSNDFQKAYDAWGRICFTNRSAQSEGVQPLVSPILISAPDCGETDAKYSTLEADLKRDVTSYQEALKQRTIALADATSAAAQRVKSRDRKIADDLQTLAQRLRQEGFEAFAPSRFQGNSPKPGWSGGRN